MDPTRQIRLLVAPFFFFVSVASAYCSAGIALPLSNDKSAFVGAIALAILPMGFLISTLTIVLLRRLFRLFGSNFETDLSEADMDRIWLQLHPKLSRRKSAQNSETKQAKTSKDEEIYIAASFDHGFLYENHRGLHEWLMRVYSAFMTSANSFVAILLSYVAKLILDLHPSYFWWLCTVTVEILLLIGAIMARRNLLGMLRFQFNRDFAN